MNTKKIDLIFLIIYPFFATSVSFLFNINFFFSILVFFGVPSIFLSLRAKEYVVHTLIFSLIFAIPFTIVLDYITHVTRTYLFLDSIFNIRLLEYVTIDMILLGIFSTYFIIIFYRYFFGEHAPHKLYVRNTTPLIILLLLLLLIFFILLIFSSDSLRIPYFYLICGIVIFLVPLSTTCFVFKKIRYRFLKVGFYFFVFNLLYEITALKLRWWEFPREGEFVGWINFLGVAFPFEEFFFWIMLSAPSVVSWFVLFGEDRKKFFG